jgi:transcriptional regulator with XRE-family HTH domain
MAGSPTALRMRLGIQLRALRERAGITPAQAADAIRATPSKISRMELGKVPLKERDLLDLTVLYGLGEGPERKALLDSARSTARPAWWYQYRDALPAWRRGYLGLEAAAASVRCYAPHQVPQILQTEQYSAAVTRARHGVAEAAQHRALHAAMQERLWNQDRPQLWVIIEECALRRPAVGKDLMRQQMGHLISACKEPGITIQVRPLTAPVCPGAGVPFSVLRFTDRGLPDVVYYETPAKGHLLDRAGEADAWLEVINNLVLTALPAEETTGILESLW